MVARVRKEEHVAALKEVFETSTIVVVSHYRGLSVDDMNKLRSSARENDARVKVTKNTLAKIAANDTDFALLSEQLSGPTAITYSEGAVAAAKTTVDFAKKNDKLVILGAVYGGKILDEAGVKVLASTPPLVESRGKIVGLLTASASRMVGVLQAPGGQVARVLSARGAQQEA